MNIEEFRKNAHATVDWMAEYYSHLEEQPVKSQVSPGDVFNAIPKVAPGQGEPFDLLIEDLDEKIMPGMTHWQHPHFHAYFPGNSSFPSILAEMITATLGAQCMVWETSPAAAELEERMMEWLKQMMGLPVHWSGVIQDTASTGTLVALLSARERHSNFGINKHGFQQERLRVYCSEETHSSIEKAIKIAGFGSENLIKIPVDNKMAMEISSLITAIERDIEAGFHPCAVVSTLGSTGTMAIDPIEEIADVCSQYNIWHHIDAAYAGSALILPEYKGLTKGFESADSFLFNPHKWLFVNFDCSAYFVKNKEILLRTFEILPEYLKTSTRGEVNDYRDWGIPLGRRFRALKLWFVIRTFGTERLQQTIRQHIEWSQWLESKIDAHPDFEVIVPSSMGMVVFRYHPEGVKETDLNDLNEKVLKKINSSGKAYLTHTKIGSRYVIRLVTAQTYLTKKHVVELWDWIGEMTSEL